MSIRTKVFVGLLALCSLSNLHLVADDPVGKSRMTGLRQVGMKISLDDQELWEASYSDDGRQDADAVWGYLKEAHFSQGRDLRANEAKIDRDGDVVSLKGNIVVDVDYGGKKALRELTLNRVKTEKGERWTISDESVDEWFWSRLVSRRHAAHLKGRDELSDH